MFIPFVISSISFGLYINLCILFPYIRFFKRILASARKGINIFEQVTGVLKFQNFLIFIICRVVQIANNHIPVSAV